MSKSRGKFTKKKEFGKDSDSFEKDQGGRRKPAKDKTTKYRKKKFRDYEGNSDEDDGKQSASDKRSGSGKDSRQAARSRSRDFKTDVPDKKGRKGVVGKRDTGTQKPFARHGGRTPEPPVYESFPTLPGAKKKVSAEERNIRLNKSIADAGVCSRREADKLIEAGEIKVNGETITEMGYKVSRRDVVTYKGKKLKQEKLVYVLLNKPKDFITTLDDPDDRKTVMQLVQNACNERIYPVGRLDRNTTGLLLLTNDGELAKKLTHPSHNIKKVYQVDLDKPLTEEDFTKLQEGIVLEDGEAKVDELAVLSADRTILGVEIHIGRNRIVRRMFEHLGYEVIRLDRVMFAGLTKKDLPRGKWRYLSEKEFIRLKHFK